MPIILPCSVQHFRGIHQPKYVLWVNEGLQANCGLWFTKIVHLASCRLSKTIKLTISWSELFHFLQKNSQEVLWLFNYTWAINNCIAYSGAPYSRGLTVMLYCMELSMCSSLFDSVTFSWCCTWAIMHEIILNWCASTRNKASSHLVSKNHDLCDTINCDNYFVTFLLIFIYS